MRGRSASLSLSRVAAFANGSVGRALNCTVTSAVRALAAAALSIWVGGCGDAKPAAPARGPAPPAGGSTRPLPDPEAEGEGPAQAVSLELGPELRVITLLIAQNRAPEARGQLEAYRQAHPRDGRAAFLLGLTYHREKRYALARPLFEEATRLEPGYPTTYHFLGWCLYYLGEPDAARKAFEQHLRHVEEGDSYFGIGLIDLDQDRLDDAASRFRQAIALQEGRRDRVREVSKAHARLADVYLRREELPAARDELRRATELWPQHYTAFFKLSRVLARLGDAKGADDAFRLYRYWQARAEVPRGVPETPRGVPEPAP